MVSRPNIRFEGYTDDWEQRKMGDVVSFSKGSGYSKGDLKEDGTPIILYGRLYTKYETVISEVDTFVDEKKGSVYSKGGEVIVPASGETAEDISIASVVEKSGVLLGGDLNIITPPKDMDSAFLAISISNGKPHNDMAKMAQGKSVVHLHNSDLGKIDLPYPNYDEQKRISGFFSDLDNLITLHQRKCDETKELKKYMLQKMFPKNGKKRPEIRFEGFNDDWEQRKLMEISDIITGTTPPTKDKDNYGGNRLFVSPADIQGNRYVDGTITTLTEKGYALGRELRAGTTLFVSIGSTIGKVAQIKESATTNQQINAVIPYSEMDDNFVFTMLENEADKIKKLAATQAVPIINKTTFGETEIQFPKKEEQTRIGEYFSNLDNLITLHQRKCDQLKEVKKFMLQNMFPGRD